MLLITLSMIRSLRTIAGRALVSCPWDVARQHPHQFLVSRFAKAFTLMHPGPVPKNSPPIENSDPSISSISPAHPLHPGWLVGRSLFPIVATVLILGTLWWGPWITMILAILWWRTVTQLIG
ncbi:MAG: hypothetical protein ACI8TQ_001235 [Planctomycetota bacterium]|jgi:hypothetical protein